MLPLSRPRSCSGRLPDSQTERRWVESLLQLQSAWPSGCKSITSHLQSLYSRLTHDSATARAQESLVPDVEAHLLAEVPSRVLASVGAVDSRPAALRPATSAAGPTTSPVTAKRKP